MPKRAHPHTHSLLCHVYGPRGKKAKVVDLKPICSTSVIRGQIIRGQDEVISLVTLGPVNTINTTVPGHGPPGWGCMLSASLTQRLGCAHPSHLAEAAGVRDRQWGPWEVRGVYVLLTCRCRAWPSTYFPGGLVWAGTGPDAVRTAAGRFATRQEKSVDSTQFQPSTLPCRMFPSMPVLSFYSFSSGFRCLCDQWGMVPRDGDRDLVGGGQLTALSI